MSDTFDAKVIDAWVKFWNTYDLNQLDELFTGGDRVTYLSSEREGAITGIDAVRRHHEGFGFVNGGKHTDNRLWLESTQVQCFEGCRIVVAVWYFRRAANGTVQRGPVTLVYVPIDGAWKIAHANFSNYPGK